MRLVLLPGLNGSSRLFSPLLPHLAGCTVQVLELPEIGPQDYASLTEVLLDQLGHSPFILLGESFSGPLAYRLAQCRPVGLRAVIFAASFLVCPHPLTRLLPLMPLRRELLSNTTLLRWFCAGSKADHAMLELLRDEICSLPTQLLRARLHSLGQLKAPTNRLDLPVLQLQPTRDRLVTTAAAASPRQYCPQLQSLKINAPHFVLQTRPAESGSAISRFVAAQLDG